MPIMPRKLLLWTLALAALLAIFTLYAQPGFVVMMADQLWACF